MHAAAPATHTDDDHANATGPSGSWLTLILLCVAQFMVILDVTIVNVALPAIGADLGFVAADLQWVVSAYVIATGGLILIGGRIADLLGRRRIFAVGLVLFTAASLASGLAWSPESLVAARALQGVGAALFSPAALSLVTTTYTGHRRAVALGIWGAIAAGGAAVGVLAGGVLTSALSWEWVFFVNVPIGLVVVAAVARVVPADKPAERTGRRPDVLGAGLLIAGLVVLVYGIDGAADHGWGSTRTLILLAGGGLLLTAFALAERRVAAPMIPPRSWRIRSLVLSAATIFAATGLLVGTFFLNSLYLQHELDASALETGAAFLPLTLAILAGAHASSTLAPRLGTRALVSAGLALMAVGSAALAAAPDHAAYAADLLPGFLVLGVGTGLIFVPVSIAAMADVSHNEAGLASGLMMTAHELGAALGVAVMTAVAGATSLAQGYGRGFLVAAAIAAGLALLSVFTAPAVRPPAGAGAHMH